MQNLNWADADSSSVKLDSRRMNSSNLNFRSIEKVEQLEETDKVLMSIDFPFVIYYNDSWLLVIPGKHRHPWQNFKVSLTIKLQVINKASSFGNMSAVERTHLRQESFIPIELSLQLVFTICCSMCFTNLNMQQSTICSNWKINLFDLL